MHTYGSIGQLLLQQQSSWHWQIILSAYGLGLGRSTALLPLYKHTGGKRRPMHRLWHSQGPMGLTADLEWRLQLQQDWLTEEDFPGLEAQPTDLVLCQLHILAWSRALHWRETDRQTDKEVFDRSASHTHRSPHIHTNKHIRRENVGLTPNDKHEFHTDKKKNPV